MYACGHKTPVTGRQNYLCMYERIAVAGSVAVYIFDPFFFVQKGKKRVSPFSLFFLVLRRS